MRHVAHVLCIGRWWWCCCCRWGARAAAAQRACRLCCRRAAAVPQINAALKEPMIPGSLAITTKGADLVAAYDPAKEFTFEVRRLHGTQVHLCCGAVGVRRAHASKQAGAHRVKQAGQMPADPDPLHHPEPIPRGETPHRARTSATRPPAHPPMLPMLRNAAPCSCCRLPMRRRHPSRGAGP